LLLGLKTSPRIASASASVFAAGGDQMGENRPRRHRGDAGVNKSMARAVTGVVISLFVLLGAGHAAAATSSDASDVKKLAVDVTWAGIRAQYGRVWPRLHPKYQRATTRAFWESCQRKRAAKTPGVEWISVDAIDAYPDRVALPLLGTINVMAVTIWAKYNFLGATRTAVDTVYWTKVGTAWRGLWKPEQYRAYRNHRCPA
jgi:hypothetical protein